MLTFLFLTASWAICFRRYGSTIFSPSLLNDFAFFNNISYSVKIKAAALFAR